jgi:hypothetical protein
MGDFDGPVHKGTLNGFGIAVCSRCGETWPCDVTELREGYADLKRQLQEARERGVQIWDYYLMIREGIFRIMSKELPERDKRIRAEAQAQLRESEARLRKANCDYGDGWLSDDLECQVDVEPWCGKHAVLYYIKALHKSEAAQEEFATKAREEIDAHKKTYDNALSATSRLQQELWKSEAAQEGVRAHVETMANIAAERLQQFPADGYFRQLYDEGCIALEMIDTALPSPSGLRCIDCNQPLTGVHYGAGTGDGQRFRCERCHGLLDALKAGYEALAAILRLALAGTTASELGYERASGKTSPKHIIEEARAALKLMEQYIGGRDVPLSWFGPKLIRD